jgi:hypothetical protein
MKNATKKKLVIAKVPSAATQLLALQTKFKRLREVQHLIEQAKELYREQDALIEELLPLFIDIDQDRITIKREIQIGSQKYRYRPSLIADASTKLRAKTWKASAFPTGIIS